MFEEVIANIGKLVTLGEVSKMPCCCYIVVHIIANEQLTVDSTCTISRLTVAVESEDTIIAILLKLAVVPRRSLNE